MSKKKLHIAVAAVVLLGLVIFLVVKRDQYKSNSLSERAKEFIQNQKKNPESQWYGVDLEKKRNAAINTPQIKQVGQCFSLDVPFPITDIKHMGTCFDRFATDLPKGAVIVYVQDSNVNFIDDDSGVHMRRTYVDKYDERNIKVGDREYLVFKLKNGGYERSAFYLSSGKLFVLNLLSDTNENLDKQFERMLSSVKFYNE